MINRAYMFNKFIRYDELNSMLSSMPSSKTLIGKPLDIFIDIKSIYKDVLSTEFMSSDIKTLSINILNMAAHYRYFFRNALKTNVRVYLLNSEENLIGNLCQISNYGQDLFKTIEILCKFFPDIYYIYRQGYNPCAIISYLISKESSIDNGKLIISNDIFSYQLPTLFQNTFLLHVGIKHKKLISYSTAIDAQFKNTTPSSDISPLLIPVLMALNKCTELSLPLLYPYKSALKKLREAIKANVFIQGRNPPFEKVDYLLDIYGFYSRWIMCDLPTKSLKYYNSPDILDETWKVKRQCDFSILASIIDDKINTNHEDILNYIYLLA